MKKRLLAAATLVGLIAVGSPLSADHSWGRFHWARTSNPLALTLEYRLNATWKSHFDAAVTEWGRSAVLTLSTAAASAQQTANCSPVLGRIEVCNGNYGANGWLGIASIWTTRGTHIAQATTKVNDHYFNQASYNSPEWRQMVMCQEVGHDFGLDHQDEDFDNANLGTCMDYTSDPATNLTPNQHDYDELAGIYGHLDKFTTAGLTSTATARGVPGQLARGQFGRLIRSTNGGRTELYVLELGNGDQVYTHVIWADQ